MVVVDEFATLAAELPDFLGALVGVAQRGRSLGIHLVLATQRPAGVVSDDIRANTNLRIALRLQDVADARDVVGHDAPASFPRGAPGSGDAPPRRRRARRCSRPRAARRRPTPVRDDRLHVVAERGRRTPAGEAELAVLVRTIRNAAALSDVAAPHRPWLPPLPAPPSGRRASPQSAAATARSGLVDDPADQRRRALRWSPADGNLAIVGGRGSGTTTALRAVVAAAMRDRVAGRVATSTSSTAAGTTGLDELAALAHCGGVVRPHERERLSRLLRRLAAELDERRAEPASPGRPDIVLAVDGMPALRAALDDPLDHGDLDLLGRLVAEGPAVGIVTVMTAERPAALPAALLATCATRWIGQLDDPTEATVCGVPAAARAPAADPAGSSSPAPGWQAQIAADVGPLDRVAGRGTGAARRPAGARRPQLPAGARAGGDARLDVGVDFETLGPAVLAVPDGEHVLVAGPPRSGRTTALAALLASWRAVHPGGLGRRRRPVGRRPASVAPEVRRRSTPALGAIAGRARRRGRRCSSSTTPSASTTPALAALVGGATARPPRRRRRPTRRAAPAVRALDDRRAAQPARGAPRRVRRRRRRPARRAPAAAAPIPARPGLGVARRRRRTPPGAGQSVTTPARRRRRRSRSAAASASFQPSFLPLCSTERS